VAGSPTRNQRVYADVRTAILTGRLRPGQQLPFAEMCREFATSVGVLRETLTRLSAEGLVRSQPKIGFSVIPLDAEDFKNLTDASAGVESLIVQESVASGDVDWESHVVATHHRLARTPATPEDVAGRYPRKWVVAHSDFHRALLAGCPNGRLRSLGERLRDVNELYWCWARPFKPDVQELLDAEHLALRDVVLSRDAKRAGELLMRHIKRGSETELYDVSAPR
jgi:DNA-binding GntR family transcriptional regulator